MVRFTATDGAIIIVTIGDGILGGTIGALAFGSLTITIHGTAHGTTHGTILIVSTVATTILATLIMGTIGTEDVPILILMEKDQGIEIQEV
jgi:hypothetical protein